MSEEPLTSERAARECAESLVRVRDSAVPFDGPAPTFGVNVGTDVASVTCWLGSERNAADHAAALKGEVTAAALACVERCLRDCPVPGGLSDERLAEIQDTYLTVMGNPEMRMSHDEDVLDLLAEVLHLRAALREIVRSGCEPEAYALGMARGEALGRARGARDQREADERTLGAMAAGSMARAMFEAVRDAPLVTPPHA